MDAEILLTSGNSTQVPYFSTDQRFPLFFDRSQRKLDVNEIFDLQELATDRAVDILIRFG